MPALGRGSKGGVESGTSPGSRIARFFTRPALSSFLPKTVFYVVVEEDDVDYLLTAVCGTLASEGGPTDCGRGLAIVSPIEGQFGIHDEVTGLADETVDIDATILNEEAQTS